MLITNHGPLAAVEAPVPSSHAPQTNQPSTASCHPQHHSLHHLSLSGHSHSHSHYLHSHSAHFDFDDATACEAFVRLPGFLPGPWSFLALTGLSSVVVAAADSVDHYHSRSHSV